MLPTIKFDNQFCFMAIEINNIVTNNLLSQEVLIFYLSPLDPMP